MKDGLMEEPKTVSVKPGDWVLFRGSGFERVTVDLAEVAKVGPSLVKFVGKYYPRQCHILSVVAAFPTRDQAVRVQNSIAGIGGEYARRRSATNEEHARRITEALTAANQQIRTLIASEATHG
jgi:hypothetical protein